ncbi:unnamed protein product [Moneuplotes crassus]|uniref:Uncharacterized protein n=1 Tax=Euplotes crassus TaxID=5936 RepID=A0AAD1XV82_EUPCR|nr:unnamed protein product [Moneuplotes crassus]
MNYSHSGTLPNKERKVEFESLTASHKKPKKTAAVRSSSKFEETSKESKNFEYRRSSDPIQTYRAPWKATKRVFEPFDKDNYWYTGNVRADIVYKSSHMLPRSYKDDKLDNYSKPFRVPARHPDQIKEKKYLTKIGRMALKKRMKEADNYYNKKLEAEKEYYQNRRYLLENMGKGTIDPPFVSARNSTIKPFSIMSEHNMYFKPAK